MDVAQKIVLVVPRVQRVIRTEGTQCSASLARRAAHARALSCSSDASSPSHGWSAESDVMSQERSADALVHGSVESHEAFRLLIQHSSC
jgi:hypothetical protein